MNRIASSFLLALALGFAAASAPGCDEGGGSCEDVYLTCRGACSDANALCWDAVGALDPFPPDGKAEEICDVPLTACHCRCGPPPDVFDALCT